MMNYCTIAGNLCADATMRTVKVGDTSRNVVSFRVAVNGPRTATRPEGTVEFYNVSTWSNAFDANGQPKENKLVRYLKKGRFVTCHCHGMRASAYIDRTGKPAASIEMTLDEIAFGAAFNPAEEAAPVAAINDVTPVAQMAGQPIAVGAEVTLPWE